MSARAIQHYLDRERPVTHGATMDDNRRAQAEAMNAERQAHDEGHLPIEVDGPIVVVEDDRRACTATILGLRPLGLPLESLVRDEPYHAALDAIRRITTRPPAVLVVDGLEGYGPLVVDVARSEGVPVVAYTGEPARFCRLGAPVVCKPQIAELVQAVRREVSP